MSSTGELRGATALVTGASRGIGRATARALVDAGARVTLLARDRGTLEALARETGPAASVLPADLTDADSVAEALEILERESGPPDLVVNAAGVFDLETLDRATVETLDRNLAVNLRGAFLLLRGLLPAMLERGSGRIVNVGSVAGRRPLPGNGAYAASKYGLRGLHEVLVQELRGTGVGATLVEPGAVDTSIWDPMTPDEREDLPSRSDMLDPADVADAILFVCTRKERVRIPFLPVEPA